MLSKTLKRISAITMFFISLFYFFTSTAQNYPAVLDQNTLNGKNGFIVTGLNAGDAIGTELSFVGDINNDGLEDIAINTQYIEPDGLDLQGTTYIIFGSRNAFPSPFDLTTLNGTNGFKVVGIAEDERRGKSIGKLGDINGDGIDDIALSSEGEKHIFLYGRNGAFPASMTITDINGTNGFFFNGDGIGEIKGAGDVNGDGYNDVVMGQYAWSGATYILFGKNGNFPLNIDVNFLGDGIKGFILKKIDANISAFYVGAAGDINKDGYDDLIVGIWTGSTEAQKLTYVYFGHAAPFTSTVDLKSVNGTNGFSIKNNSSNFLIPVGTLGDINGDGVDDFFSGNNIIFGSSNPGAFTNNLTVNGTNGFGLTGYTQTSAAIGDINRDGIDDFIVVASSENWIIFGSTQPFTSTFDAATLDGTKGFKIKNLKHSNVGRQVSGNADVNGDGFPDFMLSSSGEGTGSFNSGGHGFVYVVFSGDHFAKPLTTDYPKAINIESTSFTLQVNATEKGKVYYAVYPGTNPAITSTATIFNGTGSLQYGEITVGQISTNFTKDILNLSPNKKYDVYVYFEDAAGNKTGIYKLDDVTTLAGDTQPPVIQCPINRNIDYNGILPDYISTIVVTDNLDAAPKIVQSPMAGTVVTPNTLVTITATDNANNKTTCTFPVVVSNAINPKAINIARTSFALEVNATEKGKVYYAVYPGAQAAVTTTTAILNGTGALQFGSITADQLSTSLTKDITGLSSSTKYDVYVYFEDVAGNKTGIYKLDDVTTLAAGDTQPPVIECYANGSIGCNGVLPDYTSTIIVSDNDDASPKVTQTPSAGTVVNPNTLVTITATDKFNNTSTCTFPVVISNLIYCQANQTTTATSLAMPDYTKGRSVSGFCSVTPHITQTPAPGTIITSNVVVTLTATAGNITSTCSFTLTVNSSVTSTESAAGNMDLIVYPNPAKDVVYIKGSEYDTYEVIDNLGNVILQGKNETEINVANIAQGMYLILFYNVQHQVVAMKKIIKN